MNDLMKQIVGIVMILLVVSVPLAGLMAWEPVNEGNVKVVDRFGKVQEQVLLPGPHLVNPITESTHSLSVRPQSYTMSAKSSEGETVGDDSVRVLTNDGVKVDIDVTVRYRIDETKAVTFYRRHKTLENAEVVLIRPTIRSVLRTEGGDISTQYIYTGAGQDQMRDAVIEALEPEFKKSGLILEAVQIRNVELPESYSQSIEQKEIAKQKAEQAQNEVVLAEKEKQKQIIRAEADASERVIRAQAEAESELIRAEAVAESNRKIAASVDDRLIRYEWTKAVGRDGIYYVPIGENGMPIILQQGDDD